MSALSDTEDPPPNVCTSPVEIVKDGPATNRPDAPFQHERPSTLDSPLYKRLGSIEAYMARGEEREDRWEGLFEEVFEELGDTKKYQTARTLEHAAETIEPNGLSGCTILVVEPDGDLLKRTAAALAAHGCFPSMGRSRGEAMTLLAANGDFDLALVDIRCPQTHDGVELCRHLALAHRKTPVVVMGTRLRASDLDSLRVARLKIPFTADALHERLAEAAGNERATRDTERPAGEDDTSPSVYVADHLPITRPDSPDAMRGPFPGGDLPG